MNKVILIGRLTRDPELRFAAGTGNAVARFNIAVKRQFKKDESDFINCVVFGKQAETIAQHFSKGKSIVITGNIRTGSYSTDDGRKRYTTDVVVESFEFIAEGKSVKETNTVNEDKFYEDMMPVDDGDSPW